MTISFDTSELRTLAFDLNGSGVKALGAARGLVAHGAGNIQRQLYKEMSRSKHFGQAAGSIGFTMTSDATGVSAEIGPDKSKVLPNTSKLRPHVGPHTPGNLANLAYFGGSRGGGTVPDPQGALDKEAPRFADALAKIIAGTI